MPKIIIESGKGPLPILTACPTILVGALTDGQPDFSAVAWTGVACSNPPHVSIALQHQRYSLKGIRQNMVFSVNIPSEDLLKETDYCGLVTGARVNKVKDCHFNVFYGKLENAPFIEQCPVNHACEVVQILNLGSHELIIGKIVETHISEDCLTSGRPDATKIKPVIFAGMSYFALGKLLGQSFSVGKDIKPGETMDTLEELKKQRK
jgi:flavin reductase (DIM6/NTAB) family NADH-FMN oxidoreductase RutF